MHDEDMAPSDRKWHLDKHDKSTGFQLWTDDHGTTITGSRAVKHRGGALFTPEEWTVTGSGKRFETLEEAQSWVDRGRVANMGTATKVVLTVLGLAVVGVGGWYLYTKRVESLLPPFQCGPGQVEGTFLDRNGEEWRWWNTEGTIDHDRSGEIHVYVGDPKGNAIRIATFGVSDPKAFCDAVRTYLQQRGIAR